MIANCCGDALSRISNRLGLVETKTPFETEDLLRRLVPKRYWPYLNELMVKFGKDEEKTHPPRMETGLLDLGDHPPLKKTSRSS